MAGFTRREGADDTRDVVGQAGVGLDHMTQARPVLGGSLTTDKAGNGIDGHWTRVTFTPDPTDPGETLLAAAFGDPSFADRGVETAPFVVERSRNLGAAFQKTKVAASIWPRGGTPPSGPCVTYPLDVAVGDGQLAISITIDGGTPQAINPKPDAPGLYVSSLLTNVYSVDMERQALRLRYAFPAPRYVINHDETPSNQPFVLPFALHGQPGRETWGIGFVGANYARPTGSGNYSAVFSDPPKIALFSGNRAPVVRTLPSTGNTTLADIPSAVGPGGAPVIADHNDAYLAPLVVATSKKSMVAIVVRGRGNLDPASRDSSGTRFGYLPLPSPRIYWTEDEGVTWLERPGAGWDMTLYQPWQLTSGGFTIGQNPTLTNPQALRAGLLGVPWTPDSALLAGFFMDASNAAQGGAWRIFRAGKDLTVQVAEVDAPGYQIDLRSACRPRGAAVISYYARAHLDTALNNTTTGVVGPGQPPKYLTGEFAYLYARLSLDGTVLIDDSAGYLEHAGVIVVLEDGTVLRRPFPWSRLRSGASPSVFCLDNEGRAIGTAVYEPATAGQEGGWYIYRSTDLGQTWRRAAVLTRKCPAPRMAYDGETGPSYPPERAVIAGKQYRPDQGDELAYVSPSVVTPLRFEGAAARAYPGAPWLYR